MRRGVRVGGAGRDFRDGFAVVVVVDAGVVLTLRFESCGSLGL